MAVVSTFLLGKYYSGCNYILSLVVEVAAAATSMAVITGKMLLIYIILVLLVQPITTTFVVNDSCCHALVVRTLLAAKITIAVYSFEKARGEINGLFR